MITIMRTVVETPTFTNKLTNCGRKMNGWSSSPGLRLTRKLAM